MSNENPSETPQVTVPMFTFEADKPKPATKPDKVSSGNTLIQSLLKTDAPEVFVKLRQVTELLGEEKTNEICLFVKKMKRLVRPRIRTDSLIPPKKQFTETEYAGFITADLFEAIKQAQSIKVARVPQSTGEPNPTILKAAKAQHGG